MLILCFFNLFVVIVCDLCWYVSVWTVMVFGPTCYAALDPYRFSKGKPTWFHLSICYMLVIGVGYGHGCTWMHTQVQYGCKGLAAEVFCSGMDDATSWKIGLFRWPEKTKDEQVDNLQTIQHNHASWMCFGRLHLDNHITQQQASGNKQ